MASPIPLPSIVTSLVSEEPVKLLVRKHESVEVWQVIPLLLAAVLLTIGLAMFLGGTVDLVDIVQPIIVVFGGTLVALLVTFSTGQLSQALQLALTRGLRGGSSPDDMIRAMMKICDVSRRDGLLAVAEVHSSSEEVEAACHLIGEAATDAVIRFNMERRLEGERLFSRMTLDVFVFTAIYAFLMGILGSLINFVNPADATLSVFDGAVLLPFVCGVSLSILMCILIGRLRAAHVRTMITAEIAYRGAAIILEDNNVQRLRGRLTLLMPARLRH